MPEILELESRKKIYELVRKHAGCHFRELERISKISSGTLKYHLDYLAKHKLLNRVKENNNLRYYPAEISIDNALLGILRQKNLRTILLFIATNENSNNEKIAGYTNLSTSTVSWHIKKLEDAKIISPHKEGRKTFYKTLIAKNEIVNLLITYRESFLDLLVENVIEMWAIK